MAKDLVKRCKRYATGARKWVIETFGKSKHKKDGKARRQLVPYLPPRTLGMAHGRWDGSPVPFCVTRKQKTKRSIAVAFFETVGDGPALERLAYQDQDGGVTVRLSFTSGSTPALEFRPPRIEQGKLADPEGGAYVRLAP